MPAPLDPQVVDRVTKFWANEGHPLGAEKPSRRSLYDRYKQKVGDELSWGAFSDVVKKLEFRAPPDPFPLAQWKPWADHNEESPEETDFLLLLNYIKQVECGVGLYEHEARWGRRLRVGLGGLNPYGQYKLVSLYATRDVLNYYLKRPQYTADLDGFVAFKPWRPHHNWAAYRIYLLALETGVVQFPEVDPRPGLGDDVDLASIPGVQFPEGPGPEEYPDLDRRLRSGLLWLLMPPKELPTDRESDPQKREILELLLHLWTCELETSQSFQDRQQVQELLALLAGRSLNEQEQPREEQLVRD
jgi:hypothetical protein